jgi:dUTP pyrophosphatase
MKVNFKKLVPQAQKPKFGKPGDAGADLVATTVEAIERFKDGQIVYGTGIAVEIPEGMVGLIFPRSSIRNYDLTMANSVGVIDSGYRGEIFVTFNVRADHKILDATEHVDTVEDILVHVENEDFKVYKEGDRIAQLIIMPVPLITYSEVDELSETQRGEGGHGSTGK